MCHRRADRIKHFRDPAGGPPTPNSQGNDKPTTFRRGSGSYGPTKPWRSASSRIRWMSSASWLLPSPKKTEAAAGEAARECRGRIDAVSAPIDRDQFAALGGPWEAVSLPGISKDRLSNCIEAGGRTQRLHEEAYRGVTTVGRSQPSRSATTCAATVDCHMRVSTDWLPARM